MKRFVLTIVILATLMMASSAVAVSVESVDAAKTDDKAKQADSKTDQTAQESTDKAQSAPKSSDEAKSNSGALEKLDVLRQKVRDSKSGTRSGRKYDYFQDSNKDGVDDAARKGKAASSEKKAPQEAVKPKSAPQSEPKTATPDNASGTVKKKKP